MIDLGATMAPRDTAVFGPRQWAETTPGLPVYAYAMKVDEVRAWIRERFELSWLQTALVVTALNAVLATICLRVGGQLLKGPYLPETVAGLARTTRVFTGRFDT